MENTGDKGSSNSISLDIVTPYEGISAYNKKLGNQVELYDGPDTKIAAKMAKDADHVIVVVGYSAKDEGEYDGNEKDMKLSAEAGQLVGKRAMGGDRESLKLLPEDEALILEAAKQNNNIVVVYVGGSAINMNHWQDEVSGILFSWYSGMQGGTALANILYGDVNPSGKLPFSIAKNDQDYPYFNPFTFEIEYGYYHGYTLFDKKNIEVSFPFGYGLSYTNYSYDKLTIENSELTIDDTLKASIEVTNIGNMAGEEVVQLYIGFQNSRIDRPVKLLRGFDKIKLQPGETKVVSFEVKIEDLAWYDPEVKQWKVEKMVYEILVGPNSDTNNLIKSLFTLQ